MKHKLLLLLTLLILCNPYSVIAYGIDDEITTLDQGVINLNQYEGELLVLEFFSTTCSHCVDYHPNLVEINNQYSSQISLVSVSINKDDTIEVLEDFVSDYPSNWTVGRDEDRSLVDKFNIPGTPSTLFFDTVGELKACYLGTQTVSELSSNLDTYITDPSGFIGPLEDGVCEGPSALDQFLGSIFFPIVMGLLIYGIYIAYRRYTRK